MVGDVHRTLLYGGIFGYPGDINNPNGGLNCLLSHILLSGRPHTTLVVVVPSFFFCFVATVGAGN